MPALAVIVSDFLLLDSTGSRVVVVVVVNSSNVIQSTELEYDLHDDDFIVESK